MIRPVTLFHHRPDYRLAHTKYRTEIGVDDVIPLFILHHHQQIIARDTGVIHQNVGCAETFDNLFETSSYRFPVSHIEHHTSTFYPPHRRVRR